MSRRHHKNYKHKNKDKDDIRDYIPMVIIFIIGVIVLTPWYFIKNCIFEFPIRWDVGTCWHEQVETAKKDASEYAVKFAP